MFKKVLKSIASTSEPVTPQQGIRLEHSQAPHGASTFTIRGQRLPGFFIFFGLLFGSIPTVALFAILFGSSDPNPDSDSLSGTFGVLFLTPFFLVGTITFFIGLFLWLGKTVIQVERREISVQRILFGKAFQTKKFQQTHLDLLFEESHRNNDVPAYKLTLKDNTAKNKIGVGGSLKEAELLWLERELREALGEESIARSSVADAVGNNGLERVTEAVIDPHYRSKNLTVSRTTSGWKAQSKSTVLGAFGVMVFGSIFIIVGLVIHASGRELIFGILPFLRDLFSNAQSSGGSPPIWFSAIFAGAGLFILLQGILLLGYRNIIAVKHSRLHHERQWFIFAFPRVYDFENLTRLEPVVSGEVNGVPRYRLVAHFQNGKKRKLLHLASPEDAGQIYSRLNPHLKG